MTTTNLEELFSNLVIEQSDEPLPAITRPQRSAIPNPFGEALTVSLEHSTPMTTYVPADAVQRAIGLINAAARNHQPPVGVRVIPNVKRDDKGQVMKETTEVDGKQVSKAVYLAETKGENKGKVMIRFQANPDRKKVARFAVVKDADNDGMFAVRDREADAVVVNNMTKEQATADAKQRNRS